MSQFSLPTSSRPEADQSALVGNVRQFAEQCNFPLLLNASFNKLFLAIIVLIACCIDEYLDRRIASHGSVRFDYAVRMLVHLRADQLSILRSSDMSPDYTRVSLVDTRNPPHGVMFPASVIAVCDKLLEIYRELDVALGVFDHSYYMRATAQMLPALVYRPAGTIAALVKSRAELLRRAA